MMVTSTHQAGPGGILAEVDHETFRAILKRTEKPLVVVNRSGFPKTYKYLTQYGSFYFRFKSREPHDFTREADVIEVDKLHAVSEPMVL